MTRSGSGVGGFAGAMHRLHARLSGLARPATGFVSQPDPKSIGSFARGRQLSAGNFLFAGFLIEAKGRSIWDGRYLVEWAGALRAVRLPNGERDP